MKKREGLEKTLAGGSRYRDLGRFFQTVFYISILLSIYLALEFFFGWGLLGFYPSNWQYYYLLAGFLLPFLFLFVPAIKTGSRKIPWYDYVAAAFAFVIPVYFSFYVDDMQLGAWSIAPHPFNLAAAAVYILLVLEASRRAGGTGYFIICLVFGLYPLIAPFMPGHFKGPPFGLEALVGHLAFDSEGFMGIPMQVIGGILIGFLVFAGLLIKTGAGDFFLNLAMSVAGHTRGGPAKVAVVGSAFLGSLSGSIFSNIAGTGSITIPLMKRTGFSPVYAASVEACASTGGVMMPPVMGAVAFVMASLTNIPYATIMIAALIPSLLYYSVLLIQVDAYAAVNGMAGLPKEETPKFLTTLKEGWHFLFVLCVLIWGLVYMRLEAITPFYASAILIVLAMIRKETRLDFRKMLGLLDGVGKLLVDTVAIILPIALVVCGLVVTGVAPAFTSGIIDLSGGSPFWSLILGAIACYFLGMAGMLVAAYIFLSMSLAPMLIGAGFNELATHLFIIYFSMISAITPPVAAGSFLAAGIAGAPPMKVAVTTMKMGLAIYFVPFFFIYKPSLIFQGTALNTLIHLSTAFPGVLLIASAVGGYIIGAGILSMKWRLVVFAIGILLAVPSFAASLAGIVLAVALLVGLYIQRRRSARIEEPLELSANQIE